MTEPKTYKAKLSDFKPDPRNANRHTQRGRGLVEKSQRQRGFARPGFSANDNTVIGGNLSFIEVGAEVFGVDSEVLVIETDGTIPIIHKRTDIESDSPEARILGYEDNRTAELSLEWDVPTLEFDLSQGLDLDGLFSEFDLKEMGIGNGGESADAEPPDNSRAEALRDKYGVEFGDLFQLGGHLILCGDTTRWEDVQKVTEGKEVDLVFADPPYGVAIGDKNKFLNSFQKAGKNLENIAGDLMGKDELFDMLVLAFTNVHRVMKDCASIYVTAPQGGELGLMMMMMMMMMSGLPVKHVLNWIKNAPTFSMGRLDYEYQHEPILYTWKKTHKHYGLGQFNTSTWFIDKPRASPEHPTMKPVELVDNAILNSSEKGMIVFDPFLGSGTTIISCERTGRKGRAIEKDPLHVATSLERILTAFPALPLTRHPAGG